jgi:predicted DNA-binding antitoxin AbrB/MazE fold protein
MLGFAQRELLMTITIEAIYEAGVLKPLSPLPDLKEHARVRISVETPSIVDEMQGKIAIDPAVAQEIIESADYSILES